jgi:putative ABC transport system ATP-binding protein
MSNEPLIEVRQLTREYLAGEVRIAALRGVSLTIQPGEFVAIMGPSGSGKSTLLNMLGAIDVPTTGQIMLEGQDLSKLDDDAQTILRRRKIGFIFQKIHLVPTLTAIENVALPLQLDGLPTAEAMKRAEASLDAVGLAARLTHLPSAMSGGEQQRVAIARALVIDPAIVLADEPTGALDSVNGQQIVDLLRQLVAQRGHTIVVVTHDPGVAAQANRTIHVRDGLLVD